MAPALPPSDSDRPHTGRLRLAAALGGAGVLAVGLGGGVLQSQAQDPTTETLPGEAVLGEQQPTTVEPTADAATAKPSTTATETSTAVATTSGTGTPLPPRRPPSRRLRLPPSSCPPPSSRRSGRAEGRREAQAQAQAGQGRSEGRRPRGRAPEGRRRKGARQGQGPRQAAREEPAQEEHESEAHDEHDHSDVDSTPDEAPLRNAGGVPTLANPTTSLAVPGPAPIGVPNFFIDKFRIPPFLLPIYQAAGTQYGIRWEVLAAINEIETDYGRNLNVSSAGALGWMQFMPATWKAYGVDANGDGRKDPYNPVDAIFAAANYLKAAGAEEDLRKAIFAYNHADWYVESVLMRARLVGGMPVDLVGSLTGLTEGRFPVAARARYAGDLDEKRATRRIAAGQNASLPVESDGDRNGILIFAQPGASVVATHDGKVVARGTSPRLGRYVRVRDTYGNTYTYARLSKLEPSHPVAKRGLKPKRPATIRVAGEERPSTSSTQGPVKERLFAHPRRTKAFAAGGRDQLQNVETVVRGRDAYARDLLHLKPNQITWKSLEHGSTVVAGTILGRVGSTSSTRSPHMLFEIRPAGRGAPRIDPKPILDGWKLLESTAIYRAKKKNPFFGSDAEAPSVGQILLMSKDALTRRVLSNPHITMHEQGRLDVRAGRIDRRVLALLEYLTANGLRPSVTSLFRPSSITTSGNLSHHATGTAVDIGAINGISIIGHQGAGSITDIAVRRMLSLQGAMKPSQIITLMEYPNTDNTVAMGDHHDHIHVGYRPVGTPVAARSASSRRSSSPASGSRSSTASTTSRTPSCARSRRRRRSR
jgi:murein DD-endopeptidase MepM/ murein hydrolase activator NlpD